MKFLQISSMPSGTLSSSHLSNQHMYYPNLKNINHVSHSPIYVQGVEVDTMPITRLRTQFGKFKLVFLPNSPKEGRISI
jgi:hypothetical protein